MAKNENKTPRVLLTREDNSALAQILRTRGAEPIELPLIKIEPSSTGEDFADIMQDMGSYDWITFTSANGVKHFFNEFFKHTEDIRSLGFARFACVGEATAKELKNYFLRADVVPTEANALAMVKKMNEYETLENLKILCVHGNRAAKDFISQLEKDHHAIVDAVEVYKTSGVDVEKASEVATDFRKNGADIVVFASPSAVESFANNAINLLLGANAVKPKIVVIGSTTKEAVEKFGMKVAAQAENPSPEAIADAVFKALK